MSPRRKHSTDRASRRGLYALVAVGVVAVGAIAIFGAPKRLSDEPLETVPDDAVAVGMVRVRDVMHAPFVRELAGDALDDAGMARIRDACGFDPLERVDTATVFVTGDEDALGHFGFVARGPRLASEELVRCVRDAVESDGGGMREVRIEGERAIAPTHGGSRAAFVGADGVTGGTEETVAGVLRAFHGDQRSAGRDPILRALWREVAADPRARDVVVVAHVPARWREAMVRRLGDDPRLALLAHVRALALAATIATEASVSLVLRTDGDESAATLIATARRMKDEALANPLAGLTPAGRALGRLQLESDGDEAIAALDLGADEARALWRAIDAALQPEPELIPLPGDVNGGQAPPSPPPEPDEILRPPSP